MMGIRKSIWITFTLALTFSMGAQADDLVDRINRLCLSETGHEASEREFFDRDGQRCVRYKCSISTGNIDESSPILSANEAEGPRGAQASAYHETCIDVDRLVQEQLERERAEAAERARRDREDLERGRRAREEGWNGNGNGSGNGSGSASGSASIEIGPFDLGDEILVGGEIIIVGSGDYKAICLDANGNLRSRCRNAEIVGHNSDWTIGRSIDSGRGDTGYRVVRRNGKGDNGGVVTWMYNGRRYECTAGVDIEICLRDRYGIILSSAGDAYICTHCDGSASFRASARVGTDWAGILGGVAEVAGAVLPPVMGYMGQKAWANAYLGSNEAWAGAAATGFEQCRMMQTHYVDATYGYITGNELPDRDVIPPECNGYNLNSFAGNINGMVNSPFGTWGNPYGNAGYTNSFMASMYGPSLGYNPYLNVNSGYVNPHLGLYGPGASLHGNLNLNSLLGLPPNGLNFNGSLNTGLNTGFNTGVYANPYAGAYANPYAYNNGAMMCVTSPCPNGNFNGNFNGNYNLPGANLNGSINLNAGANPYFNGNYGNPYFNGNYNGHPNYPNNGSYWGNNTSVNGNGFWSVQNAHMSNQASMQAGNIYQQQALANQVGNAQMNYAGYTGNTGYNPGYSPYNVGMNMNSGLNLGVNAGLTAGFNFGFY